MSDRLDRMEAMLDRLIGNQLTHDDRIYDLQATVERNFQRVFKGMARMQADIKRSQTNIERIYEHIEDIYEHIEDLREDTKEMQGEIKGLQLENRRLIEELRDRRDKA